MRCWLSACVEVAVGKVSSHLSDSRENWRRVCPSHGEDKWECNKFGAIWSGRKYYPSFRYIFNFKSNSVEAIVNVEFNDFWVAKL